MPVSDGEFIPVKEEKKHSYNPEDKVLYQKIKEKFQSADLKAYLTEYDLGNDFRDQVFYPLNEIVQYSDDPDYEFVDYEIEEYKKKLFLAINNFLNYKAINTFATKLGTQAIYTWKNNDYDYEEKLRINMKFNNLATAVWNAYKEFIRVCKRKLN